MREPEAVFWTFVLPLLLAGGLAIAFRDKAPEQSFIAVVASAPGDSAATRLVAALLAAAKGDSAPLRSRVIPVDSIHEVLRTGTAALVIVPQPGGGVEYRFYSFAGNEWRWRSGTLDLILPHVVPVADTHCNRGS